MKSSYSVIYTYPIKSMMYIIYSLTPIKYILSRLKFGMTFTISFSAKNSTSAGSILLWQFSRVSQTCVCDVKERRDLSRSEATNQSCPLKVTPEPAVFFHKQAIRKKITKNYFFFSLEPPLVSSFLIFFIFFPLGVDGILRRMWGY